MVSDLLLAFPLFVSTKLYRAHHLRHHRHLNTERDPDLDVVAVTRTRGQWVRLTLGDLTGVNMLKAVDTVGQFSVLGLIGRSGRDARRELGRVQLAGFGAFMVVLVAVLAATGHVLDYVVFWLVPTITVLNCIFRLRSIAEHVACENTNELDASRTVVPPLPERWLFAPCGINYHLEHHLFPAVPHYNLRTLHGRLMGVDRYATAATIRRSYLFGRSSVRGDVLAAHDARASATPT